MSFFFFCKNYFVFHFCFVSLSNSFAKHIHLLAAVIEASQKHFPDLFTAAAVRGHGTVLDGCVASFNAAARRRWLLIDKRQIIVGKPKVFECSPEPRFYCRCWRRENLIIHKKKSGVCARTGRFEMEQKRGEDSTDERHK